MCTKNIHGNVNRIAYFICQWSTSPRNFHHRWLASFGCHTDGPRLLKRTNSRIKCGRVCKRHLAFTLGPSVSRIDECCFDTSISSKLEKRVEKKCVYSSGQQQYTQTKIKVNDPFESNKYGEINFFDNFHHISSLIFPTSSLQFVICFCLYVYVRAIDATFAGVDRFL